MKERRFYHSSIAAAASTVAATVAASEIFSIRILLIFHINLYAGLLNIDITIWYANIVYIDIDALLLQLRLLQQQQLHSQFH